MRTLKLNRYDGESAANFKADVLDIIEELRAYGAKVIRFGVGKNTAHIRVYA